MLHDGRGGQFVSATKPCPVVRGAKKRSHRRGGIGHRIGLHVALPRIMAGQSVYQDFGSVVWHNAEILYFRGRPAAWTGMSRVTTCAKSGGKERAAQPLDWIQNSPYSQ